MVAALTGADLVGSESTANVGRGLDLPEVQIRVMEPGAALRSTRPALRGPASPSKKPSPKIGPRAAQVGSAGLVPDFFIVWRGT